MTPTPGQVAYEAYQMAYDCFIWTLPWHQLQPHFRHVWETAAQAVLDADSDGRHTTQAAFRYGIGDVLRLARLGPWTVRARRWIEREVMPPYAEYWVELAPEGVMQWEVEADLTPWEEEPRHA